MIRFFFTSILMRYAAWAALLLSFQFSFSNPASQGPIFSEMMEQRRAIENALQRNKELQLRMGFAQALASFIWRTYTSDTLLAADAYSNWIGIGSGKESLERRPPRDDIHEALTLQIVLLTRREENRLFSTNSKVLADASKMVMIFIPRLLFSLRDGQNWYEFMRHREVLLQNGYEPGQEPIGNMLTFLTRTAKKELSFLEHYDKIIDDKNLLIKKIEMLQTAVENEAYGRQHAWLPLDEAEEEGKSANKKNDFSTIDLFIHKITFNALNSEQRAEIQAKAFAAAKAGKKELAVRKREALYEIGFALAGDLRFVDLDDISSALYAAQCEGPMAAWHRAKQRETLKNIISFCGTVWPAYHKEFMQMSQKKK